MVRKILAIIMALSLVAAGALGCSSLSTSTSSSSGTSIETIREAEMGSEWAVRQMRITLVDELPIVLTLEKGDDVDGYFFLEKGSDVEFTVKGSSLIYESEPEDDDTTKISSDRFSFSATTSQGVAYTLTFINPNADEDDPTTLTIFLEVIYPATGSIYIPIEAD